MFKNGVEVGGTFNKGQSISFNVNQGDVVISDRGPIQVDLFGVDLNHTYELRDSDADDLSTKPVANCCSIGATSAKASQVPIVIASDSPSASTSRRLFEAPFLHPFQGASCQLLLNRCVLRLHQVIFKVDSR